MYIARLREVGVKVYNFDVIKLIYGSLGRVIYMKNRGQPESSGGNLRGANMVEGPAEISHSFILCGETQRDRSKSSACDALLDTTT